MTRFTILRKAPSVLPGFGLTLGVFVIYLSLVVLIPLAALVLKASGIGWQGFVASAMSPRAIAAYELTFTASFIAAVVNIIFGTLVAWILVRYRFPGRRIFDGMVDLPFALPTAVAGIALATLYSPNGWIGSLLAPFDIKVAYTPVGVVMALIFIGLPFVVRTLQPVLQDLDLEVEEAAASLGAKRWQVALRVFLPTILPSLLTGFALAFARGIGEYGSVIFISGNLPGKTEIAPVLIVIQLNQYNYGGAAAIGTVLLVFSFVLLLVINLLQRWSQRRYAS